jgi:alkylation response protein AidB-like acyl-CoA dehydrogenase
VNFDLDEAQEAARDLARQIFEKSTGFDRLRELEADDAGPGFDRELWRQLAASNLLGLPIGEALGGQGFGFVALCLMLEEAGRQLACVPIVESIVATAMPIEAFGSEGLAKSTVPRVASGEAILTPAFHESGGTGLARKTRTRASAGPDGYALRGEKVCVPFAAAADGILVSASTDEGLGLFLVSPGDAGVSCERQETTAHERQFVVRFDGVEVGSDRVVAEPGRGEAVLDWLEPRMATALAALALGVSEEALRRTAEYTATRKQFDRPIGSFQGVSMRAADAYIDVEAMRSTLWRAASRIEKGQAAEKAVAVARWWACMGGHRVVHTAQHLHGGMGADVDYPIHRFFLRHQHLASGLGGAGEQLFGLGDRIAREARAGVPIEEILW